jgi:hypothetical protein
MEATRSEIPVEAKVILRLGFDLEWRWGVCNVVGGRNRLEVGCGLRILMASESCSFCYVLALALLPQPWSRWRRIGMCTSYAPSRCGAQPPRPHEGASELSSRPSSRRGRAPSRSLAGALSAAEFHRAPMIRPETKEAQGLGRKSDGVLCAGGVLQNGQGASWRFFLK